MKRSASAVALWCCVGAGFATLVDATVIAYTAPSVGATFAASASTVQWFLAAYSLTFGLGLVPAGRLGDGYGRRWLLIGGLGLFLIGALLSAAALNSVALIGGRLVQGLGAGCISAQVLGMIQDHFPGASRLRALSAYTAAGSAAGLAGPLLAGAALLVLPHEFAWRLILVIPVPFILLTIWIAWRWLPSDRKSRGPIRTPLDLPGIVLLGSLVVIVTLPAIDPGLPPGSIAAVIVAALVLSGAIIWWERRYARAGKMPLFAPPLMRSRGFLTGNLVASLWFGSLVAAGTAVTIYLLQELEIPALGLALLLMPSALARLLAARFASRLFSRWGAPVVSLVLGAETLGLLLIAIGSSWLQSWHFAFAVAAIQLALGFCSGIGEPAIRVLTLVHVPSGMAGVAASFLQLTQRLAATFLVALCTGLLLADGISAESFRRVLLLCAVLTGVSLLASLGRSFRSSTA